MNVRVSMVYDGEEYSQVFNSKASFARELVNALESGQSILYPLGVSDVDTGSDNSHQVERVNGDSAQFGWVQQDFERDPYPHIDNYFRFTPTNNPAPPVGSGVNVLNGRNGFLNDDSRIGQLKDLIKLRKIKFNYIVDEDSEDEPCSVRVKHDKVLTTSQELMDYYLSLSCVFFGLELRLVNNPLIRWFRELIDLDDEYPDSKTSAVYNMTKGVNSIVYELRRKLPRKELNAVVGIDHACTMDDLKVFASVLEMDIYVVKEEEYIKTKHSLGEKGFMYTSMDELPRYRHQLRTGQFSYVDKISGASASRIDHGLDHAILMRKMNHFREYGHIEVCHSALVTKYIVNGEQLNLYDTLGYDKPQVGAKYNILDNARYDSYSSYTVSEHVPLNPRCDYKNPGVHIEYKEVESLQDLYDVIESINSIHKVIEEHRTAIQSNDIETRRNALNIIESSYPSIIIINPCVFKDREVIDELAQSSIINMLHIMSYVYYYTIVKPDVKGYKTHLRSYSPDMTNQQIRKLSVRNIMRLESGEKNTLFNVVRNVKSFTLCVDAHNDNGDPLLSKMPLFRFINRNKVAYDMGVNMFMNGRKEIKFIDQMLKELEVEVVKDWFKQYDREKMSDDEFKKIEDRYKEKLKQPPRIQTSAYNGIDTGNSIVREIVSGDLVSKVMRDVFIGKVPGRSILRPFMSIEPVGIEKLRVYKNNLSEPSVSRGHDTLKFDRSKKEVALVDCSKFYGSILMGAYTRILRQDYFYDSLVFGGHINPNIEQVDRPLLSYSIDNGMVFIEGSKIKWNELSKLAPTYLTNLSPYYAWLTCAKFVDVYMVIHLCSRVCDYQKTYVNHERQLEMYRHVQFDLLGIKKGMFAFSSSERKFLTNIWMDDPIPKRDGNVGYHNQRIRMDKLQDASAGLFSKMNSFAEVDSCTPAPLFKDGQPAPAVRKGMDGKRYNFKRLHQLIAKTFHIIGNYCDHDERILKMAMNKWIGTLKQGEDGGLRISTVMDRLIDEVDHNNKVVNIYNEDEKISNNTNISIIHMPYINKQCLVAQNRVSIRPKRNGLSGLRNYVINVGALAMNDLAERTGSYRNYVDSVIIDVDKIDIAKEWFNRNVPGSESKTTIEHFAPGWMPAYSVERIDLTRPLPNNCFGQEPLPLKYEIFKKLSASKCHMRTTIFEESTDYELGYEHYTHGEEHEYIELSGKLCSYNRRLLDDANHEWETLKASDLLMELARKSDMVPSHITNGVDLHRHLRSQKDDVYVQQLYSIFNERFAELVAEKSCVLYGEPGSGKTHTFGGIQKIFKSKGKKTVAASQMHSVARVCRNVVSDAHTLHYTFGTMLDVSGCCRNPKATLKNAKTMLKRMNWDVLIIDEAETVQENFEELIKAAHELGKIIYIAGDPYQSAPMMGVTGFNMFGSVAHQVCNGRKILCDLQFRNDDHVYQDTLQLAVSGQITKYLDIANYLTGWDAYKLLDEQMTETVYNVWEGKPIERTFAFTSYKVGVCIVTDVLRKLLEESSYEILKQPGTNTSCDIIISNGYEVDPSKFQARFFGTNIHKDLTKVRIKDRTRSFENHPPHWNGPSGRRMMFGTPLIMRKEMEFTSHGMFRALYDKKIVVYKASKYTFTGKYKYKTYINPSVSNIEYKGNDQPVSKRRKESNYTRVKFYVFKEAGSKYPIPLSADEISMHFMYSFAIQRDFVIGCTMDKLTMIQPFTDNSRSLQYKSTKSKLRDFERKYGEQSILTDDARMMQVMVTRTKNPGNTTVLDVPVRDKTFWESSFLYNSFLSIEQKGFTPKFTKQVQDLMQQVVEYNLLSRQLYDNEVDKPVSGAVPFKHPKYPARLLCKPDKEVVYFCPSTLDEYRLT